MYTLNVCNFCISKKELQFAVILTVSQNRASLPNPKKKKDAQEGKIEMIEVLENLIKHDQKAIITYRNFLWLF